MSGYDSVHTLDLPQRNATPDDDIVEIAKNEKRILISKDSDFLETFLLRREPAKLLIVATGNISNKVLQELFRTNIDRMVSLFETHDVLEMTRETIIVRY